MSDTQRIPGDVYFPGTVTFANAPNVPAASFGDREFEKDPAAPLAADKVAVRLRKSHSQSNAPATTQTIVLHQVMGTTAEIREVMVTNIARATGNATVTVDIRKNGVSVLTGLITLSSAAPASGATYGFVAGNLAAAPAIDCVRGDVIDAVIVATVGTGVLPTGLSVAVAVDETPD